MKRRRGPMGRQLPLPKRPFRDSAIFNAVLAAIIVVVAWATRGGLWRSLIIAAVFFVVATAWSWWRFRIRLEAQARGDAEAGAGRR